MTSNDFLTHEQLEGTEFSPLKNPDVIAIIKQPDGNYSGIMHKNGQIIQVRCGDPQTTLVELITSSGN